MNYPIGSMQTQPPQYYYIQYLGQEQGPYDINQLRQMLMMGTLRYDTFARTDQGSQWFQASQIPGLFSEKEWLVALLLAIFLGWIGVDRFYIGHVGLGIAKVVVCVVTLGIGGFIWQVVDIILIAMRKVTDQHGLPLR